MSFPGYINGSWGQEKAVDSSKMYTLGTRLVLPDGRAFRYACAGEELGAGKLCMQSASTATHDMDLVTAAAAVGSSTVTVTPGAAAATLDQFADGYLYVNDGDGEGHIYRIKSSPVNAGSVAMVITLEQGDEVKVAISATSLCGLMINPYTTVQLWDVNDIDGAPLGVPATTIASGSYGWLQTWGWAACLFDAAVPTIGSRVMPADTAVDGALEVRDAATLTPTVGVSSLIAPVDTDYGIVFLTIAP